MARLDVALAELPRLRRYVYCLHGSRTIADTLIERCLQQAVQQLFEFDGQLSGKDLFRLFHHHEAACTGLISVAAIEQEPLTPVHSSMMRLTLDERRALGLVVVSGFSRQEAAEILRISVHGLSDRLFSAQRHLAQLMPRAIIIEDEYLLASHLTDLACDMGLTVCGTAANGKAAEALAHEHRPDLVLADVWLGEEKDGAEIAETIRERYHSTVVYVTAYPDRVLAQRLHSPFIVRKPFLSADLATVIGRACRARFDPRTVH